MLQHLDDQIEEGLNGKDQEQGSLELFDAPGMIPVVSADAGDKHLNEVRMLVEHKRRQVAVRCGTDSRIGRVPLIEQVERVAEAVQVSTRDLHVLLDEVFIETADEQRALRLAATLSEVRESHEFASIGLLSGSTPQKRRDYSTHVRKRPEVELWESVQRQCEYPLRYGDYGVVHPRMADASGVPAQPNPYINYTVPGACLSITRSVPGRGPALPPGGGERYFIDAADELVNHEKFAGIDFSWGDQRFYWCRMERSPAMGSSQKWIALATSHHLAHLSRGLDFPRAS